MVSVASFVCLIYIIFTIGISNGELLPYKPEDKIRVDCGSRKNYLGPDQWRWEADIFNSSLFSLGDEKNVSIISSTVDQPTDIVPYKTARLSLSEFSYTIPLHLGPKFVRLYFYSAKYQNFDISKALFSVKAGQYTLLSNFSLSGNAEALRTEEIVKEYYINVQEKPILTITFTPSTSISEAFALISGIELISLPKDLFNWFDMYKLIKFLGQRSSYIVPNHSAMETMYRIDVGRPGEIPPNQDDTGLFRTWKTENGYLTKPGYSVVPAEPAASLIFSKIPNYTAPEDVYRTARTMGKKSRELVKSYNLTWQYPVDSGFFYIVRLHFCEIMPQVNVSGDRVFYIFIANQTAELKADVILWSGGKYIPYVKDYVVSMPMVGKEKRSNLSIALQANPHDWQSKYVDGILNGLEIFKLNDSKSNLAGTPDIIPEIALSGQQTKGKNNWKLISIALGVISVLVTIAVLTFFVLRQIRKVKASSTSERTPRRGKNSFSTTGSSNTRGSSSLPSNRCRYFSLAETIAATNNFDDTFVIGVGGFGNVYKGYIENGTTPVAIKRLKSDSSQGIQEFKTEIELLSHLRHRHLVSLIGYCNDDREMILVYEYMAHGTLRAHLYKTENPPLTWKQRLEICTGAAHGLHYLHTGTKYTIIHRDVKTTNILLDENWAAKVSDFGLSKTGPTDMSKDHLTTVVKGSVGYLDPEYYRRQQLTEKSDVYSFGVVLCEVLCGRPPIVRTAEKEQVSLAEWVQTCYHKGTLHAIIDPNLTGKIAPECLIKYGELVVKCLMDDGRERPSMKDIVGQLEFVMQLQNNAEGNDSVIGKIMKTMTDEEDTPLKHYSNDSDVAFTCSWVETQSESSGMTKIVGSSEQDSTTGDSRKGMSGTVFSEITDYPSGR